MEPYLGQIMLVGFNFQPQGWAFCDGRLLAVTQNPALFALLGTTYGGNGTSNFALPDLRGRVAIGMGQGLGLDPYTIGQQAGAQGVSLTVAQMPVHNHGFTVDGSIASTSAPAGGNIAVPTTTPGRNATAIPSFTTGAPASPATLNAGSVQNNGGGSPVPVIQPSLALNYIIALQGIFPPRS